MSKAREDEREAWTIQWIDRSRQYLRYGIRGLIREPVFALTALVTLALGTAATTTVFSVVDAELWRPLPFERPAELQAVVSRAPDSGRVDGISLAELQAWRDRAPAFAALAAHGSRSRRTAQLGHAESIITSEVTASYFMTLGRQALRGRVFTPGDASADVAVLTERGWARVFGNDPSAVGRTFLLDDRQVTILGVVANDNSSGPDGELYVPIDERSPKAAATFYTVIGRLAPGATAAEAAQQIQAAIDERAGDPDRRGDRAVVEDLSAFYQTSNARPLYFFLGASLLVLVLTIANVAGLMVSRAVRRTPEFALRAAIGGGMGSLVAQLILEGALVAVPGCAVGLVLTYGLTMVLGQFIPDDFLYRGTQIGLDARAAIATVAIAVLTTAGLSLVPLGTIRRAGERAALGAGGRTGESPSAARSRRILLTGQLAVTVILLASVGIFLKSYVALMRVPLGFDPANAWSIRVAPAGPRFAGDESLRVFVDDLVTRLRAVPGIEHVAAATSSPLRSGWLAEVTPSAAAGQAPVRAILRSVGAEYFKATATPIVRGRAIGDEDGPGAPLAAVVNEEFVRRIFAGEDPIGRSIDFVPGRVPRVGPGTATIVGVAADVKEVGLNEVTMADLYLSFAQRPHPGVEVIARGQGADSAMRAALRAAAADPLVPVTGSDALRSRVDQALQDERFHLLVVVAFAVLGVLTAAIGIYGAMAYAVTTRWREFGVRLALGAAPRSLVGRMLWQSTRLALVGGAIGLAGALLLARWIGDALYLVPGSHNGLLYDTTTTDPIALVGAVAGILLLSVVAAAAPARRAAQVDPVQALRAD